jgi:hypothetical protein
MGVYEHDLPQAVPGYLAANIVEQLKHKVRVDSYGTWQVPHFWDLGEDIVGKGVLLLVAVLPLLVD